MDTNAVILRALSEVRPNAYVTIDHLRTATDAAQLTSAEKSGGLRAACASGHLRPVYHLLPGLSLDPVHVAVPSTHPAAKGRYVLVFRRTSKRVNVVGIQHNSCDNEGNKTAPGVASTNTGSLAQPSAAKPTRSDVCT